MAGPERGPTTSTLSPPRKGEGKEGLVLLGEFGRAHGLQGEVRLKSFTAEPRAIAAYGPLVGGDGRQIVLQGVRPAGAAPDLLIARVEGVASRDAAEALNRLALLASRERLGATAEDEFLLADLIGLAVEDSRGQVIGTILAVPNYGGGDLLEIAPAGRGASALLPFTKAFVPTIDLAARRVVIDGPADLFEAAVLASPLEGEVVAKRSEGGRRRRAPSQPDQRSEPGERVPPTPTPAPPPKGALHNKSLLHKKG